jgi:mono/diheme cytochrome c family protein
LLAEDARGYGAGQALDSPWLTSLRLQRVRGRLLKYRGHGAGAMMPVADLPAELDALLDDQEAAGWPYLKRLPALQERHMEICRRAVATWP